MTRLWPRISHPVARAIFDDFGASTIPMLRANAANWHTQVSFAATGGTRVVPGEVEDLATDVRSQAAEFGYPERASDGERISFDRAAAELTYRRLEVTTFEAGNSGMWNFLAVVVLPDVTSWRFGRRNVERWIASDLTRHMFARLWWQAFTFAEPGESRLDLALLRNLSESDLNQIMERRSVAGNPRLARALARAVITSEGARREIIRDLTPRLRRRLAFVDFAALSDTQIERHIAALARNSG